MSKYDGPTVGGIKDEERTENRFEVESKGTKPLGIVAKDLLKKLNSWGVRTQLDHYDTLRQALSLSQSKLPEYDRSDALKDLDVYKKTVDGYSKLKVPVVVIKRNGVSVSASEFTNKKFSASLGLYTEDVYPREIGEGAVTRVTASLASSLDTTLFYVVSGQNTYVVPYVTSTAGKSVRLTKAALNREMEKHDLTHLPQGLRVALYQHYRKSSDALLRQHLQLMRKLRSGVGKQLLEVPSTYTKAYRVMTNVSSTALKAFFEGAKPNTVHEGGSYKPIRGKLLSSWTVDPKIFREASLLNSIGLKPTMGNLYTLLLEADISAQRDRFFANPDTLPFYLQTGNYGKEREVIGIGRIALTRTVVLKAGTSTDRDHILTRSLVDHLD